MKTGWPPPAGSILSLFAELLRFDSVRQLRYKTAKAYQLKVTFQDFYAQSDKSVAEAFLHRWYGWAIRCRLDPMVAAAKTVKTHWQGILNCFDSCISNGLREGVNSLIQASKARARGYRSIANMAAVAFLIAGKLDFNSYPLNSARSHNNDINTKKQGPILANQTRCDYNFTDSTSSIGFY